MQKRNIKTQSKNSEPKSKNYTAIITALIGAAAIIIAAYLGIIRKSDLVSITINPEKITLPIGSSVTFEAIGLNKEKINILDIDPEWSLNNPEIGILTDDKGRTITLKAIKEGRADIKVKLGSILTVAQIEVIKQAGKEIYTGTDLAPGYNMGVNTSKDRTNWLFDTNLGYMKMEYPGGQKWGAVFITVGEPQLIISNRKKEDLSKFEYLIVDLRGENGGESCAIGIKDDTDPDNGAETKINVTDLTTEWETKKFELSKFETADLTRLYIVIEFVFSGGKAQTVYFRNIKYIP